MTTGRAIGALVSESAVQSLATSCFVEFTADGEIRGGLSLLPLVLSATDTFVGTRGAGIN